MLIEYAERYNNIAVVILEIAILIMAITTLLLGSFVGMLVFLLYGQALIWFWVKVLFEDSIQSAEEDSQDEGISIVDTDV